MIKGNHQKRMLYVETLSKIFFLKKIKHLFVKYRLTVNFLNINIQFITYKLWNLIY